MQPLPSHASISAVLHELLELSQAAVESWPHEPESARSIDVLLAALGEKASAARGEIKLYLRP